MTQHDTSDTIGSSSPGPLSDDPSAPAPDDPRWALAGAVSTARTVMGAITPEQWDLPTPCEGVTVAALLEHMVMVNRRIALAGRSVPPPQWPTDAADVAPGDWLSAFTEAAHDVQASWPDDGLDEPRQVPWGTFPGREVVGVYTNELTVHTWDLARATGQAPEWDTRVLDTAWDAIRQQLPTAERGPMWAQTREFLPPDFPWTDPFADAVDVAEDAPLIDRLVAWNGRTP